MIPQPLSIEFHGTLNPSAAGTHALPLLLTIEGMQCTSCSTKIEKELKRTSGVLEATVLFLSDTAHISYLPHIISPQELLAKITRLGYRPSLHADQEEHASPGKKMFVRMGMALVLTFNVMMLSHVLYGAFFQELSGQAVRYVSVPLWIITSMVVFHSGLPVIRSGLKGFGSLNFSMDSLIATGVLSAYGYSVIQMLRGSIHLYFDTASMLVSLVLLGRYIETRSREKAAGGMRELYTWAHQKVRLVNRSGGIWRPADTLKPGDLFQAGTGERIPLDACLMSGRIVIDESILTGEPTPVNKNERDEVLGGSLILSGDATLSVLRAGRASFLGQMIGLMEEALKSKNAIELIADRIMQWLVPAMLTIAAATAVYLRWQGSSLEAALLRSISVLVITCPCALGIAVPLAKTAFVSLARQKGILLRSTDALEKAQTLDTLVFDKTGTLTRGVFAWQEMIADGVSEDEALSRVASLEVPCEHFLAHEIVRIARQRKLPLFPVNGFETLEGMGVRGRLQDDEVIAGNRSLILRSGYDLARELDEAAHTRESQGKTVVFFGWQKQVKGFVCFGDTLKECSPQVIHKLKAQGITPWLVSGDSSATTRFVADTLGITHYRGQAGPRDKVSLIHMLEHQGKRVGMVGDGINDAAALTRATVGFAIGTRTPLTQQASDVGLVSDDPHHILAFLELSALTMKTIRQNLFFAFIYNVVAIPLAVAGMVNPLVAACAMFASSLTVVGNTLRTFRRHTR